jgi:Ca-activated chloride channel homolog
MRRHSIQLAVIVLTSALRVSAQEAPVGRLVPYTVKVPVNEVSVPFHAADFSGVPIGDITVSDLRILDNGKKPKQIVSFEAYKDLPVRVGFLMDASPSAYADLPRDAFIARMYLAEFLDARKDQAFVMRFDALTQLEQDWSGDKGVLEEGLRKVRNGRGGRAGTAIFDTIYRACLNQFATQRAGTGPFTGNFLVLFSDGDDNSSHALMQDVVEECQASNTTVYAFSPESKGVLRSSDGQKILMELTAKTGGRVFFDDGRTADDAGNVRFDLRSIDANQRAQYRVVYKPAELKADGSFHHIKLDSPNRGGDIVAQSGYYAPR